MAIQFTSTTLVSNNSSEEIRKADLSLLNKINEIGKKIITISSGSEFPKNPEFGDICWRTDLSIIYFYTNSWVQIS